MFATWDYGLHSRICQIYFDKLVCDIRTYGYDLKNLTPDDEKFLQKRMKIQYNKMKKIDYRCKFNFEEMPMESIAGAAQYYHADSEVMKCLWELDDKIMNMTSIDRTTKECAVLREWLTCQFKMPTEKVHSLHDKIKRFIQNQIDEGLTSLKTSDCYITLDEIIQGTSSASSIIPRVWIWAMTILTILCYGNFQM